MTDDDETTIASFCIFYHCCLGASRGSERDGRIPNQMLPFFDTYLDYYVE
jgi:hypothetical protein